MSDLLGRLAARALGQTETIRPAIAPLFLDPPGVPARTMDDDLGTIRPETAQPDRTDVPSPPGAPALQSLPLESLARRGPSAPQVSPGVSPTPPTGSAVGLRPPPWSEAVPATETVVERSERVAELARPGGGGVALVPPPPTGAAESRPWDRQPAARTSLAFVPAEARGVSHADRFDETSAGAIASTLARLRTLAARDPGTAAAAVPSPGRVVRIHIGRIEVRSASRPAPAAPVSRTRERSRSMTLEEYLAKRRHAQE